MVVYNIALDFVPSIQSILDISKEIISTPILSQHYLIYLVQYLWHVEIREFSARCKPNFCPSSKMLQKRSLKKLCLEINIENTLKIELVRLRAKLRVCFFFSALYASGRFSKYVLE